MLAHFHFGVVAVFFIIHRRWLLSSPSIASSFCLSGMLSITSIFHNHIFSLSLFPPPQIPPFLFPLRHCRHSWVEFNSHWTYVTPLFGALFQLNVVQYSIQKYNWCTDSCVVVDGCLGGCWTGWLGALCVFCVFILLTRSHSFTLCALTPEPPGAPSPLFFLFFLFFPSHHHHLAPHTSSSSRQHSNKKITRTIPFYTI